MSIAMALCPLVLIFLFAPLVPFQVNGDMGTLGSNISRCEDVYKGSWVYDESYPLYDAYSCPFIGPDFDCRTRPDKDYLKYKWKPEGCDLPRFNGTDFLEMNRGKKIMFVGDSLSRNMWLSLVCLLHTAVPNANYTLTQSTFYVKEYDISVTLVSNPFLVDRVNDTIGILLKLDSINGGNQWKGMDVLVFNSYYWWFHTGSLQTWDFFQVGNQTVKEMDRLEAYRIALKTWSRWVDTNTDPKETDVLFLGIPAIHGGKQCQGQTKPINGSTYPGPPLPVLDILEQTFSNMQKQPHLLDITLLTQLRIDGHPSIYNDKHQCDCNHWCLAGVPDTWNQLLYRFRTLQVRR